MKILWICGSRLVGGAERVTLQILGLLRQRGHDVCAICPHDSDLKRALAADGVSTYPTNLGGSMNVLALASIRRALKTLRPDIALVTTPDEWVWSSLVPRRSTGVCLVLVRHVALRLPATVTWLAHRRADAIVAVSQAVRSNLLSRLVGQGERLHVIPNPVRFAVREGVPSRDERVQARASLGLRTDGRWIGFFGGTEPKKGIEDVLYAARRIGEEMGECDVLICGRDVRKVGARRAGEWTAAHRLKGCAHYLGEIEDVERALIACDAVAVATHSTLSEGLPLVILEAMACGTPVAAYATGGVTEAIGQDSGAGLLAAPDDPEDLARQMMKLLGDPETAAKITARALERVRERFDAQIAVDKYESLFTNLCERRGRRSDKV
jgi:glycosyltransferase involved in cell wall biosynthesis